MAEAVTAEAVIAEAAAARAGEGSAAEATAEAEATVTVAAADGQAAAVVEGSPDEKGVAWFTAQSLPHIICHLAPQQDNDYDCGERTPPAHAPSSRDMSETRLR
mmetsp:Transcript_11549/g.38011  ORF Transcript_11549/g.38011 Transcript_11549/m.38011 type:complete len:104 (+) Transcript_11549:656-967(+)